MNLTLETDEIEALTKNVLNEIIDLTQDEGSDIILSLSSTTHFQRSQSQRGQSSGVFTSGKFHCEFEIGQTMDEYFRKCSHQMVFGNYEDKKEHWNSIELILRENVDDVDGKLRNNIRGVRDRMRQRNQQLRKAHCEGMVDKLAAIKLRANIIKEKLQTQSNQ